MSCRAYLYHQRFTTRPNRRWLAIQLVRRFLQRIEAEDRAHGLSPKLVEEMVAIIRRLNESGLAILLVEQNVGVAAALASVAHVLRNGKIALTTTGAELIGNAELLHSYLGR